MTYIESYAFYGCSSLTNITIPNSVTQIGGSAFYGCADLTSIASPDGVPLQGREGRWRPTPIEYKHGAPKESDADRLQLCAQAMALGEMRGCEVPAGALY